MSPAPDGRTPCPPGSSPAPGDTCSGRREPGGDPFRGHGLGPHPEGGRYRRIYTSPAACTATGGEDRPTATVIRYVLLPGETSAWHTVASDEVWLWHGPGTLVVSTAGTGTEPAEKVSRTVLGDDCTTGQQLHVTVPADTWQSACPAENRPVAVSCMVTPGFDFSDLTTHTG